jgi:hypothetical protein
VAGLCKSVKASILQYSFGYEVEGSSRIGPFEDIVDGNVLYIKAGDKGRLLDIGCGNGRFLDQMRHFGWDVAGVEIDGEAVSVAREKFGTGPDWTAEGMPSRAKAGRKAGSFDTEHQKPGSACIWRVLARLRDSTPHVPIFSADAKSVCRSGGADHPGSADYSQSGPFYLGCKQPHQTRRHAPGWLARGARPTAAGGGAGVSVNRIWDERPKRCRRGTETDSYEVGVKDGIAN